MTTVSKSQGDAVLYRIDGATRDRVLAFLNLVSRAVSYGIVMGSARTGLGTDVPVGKSIPGGSLYYQALHAYSAFDWQFQSQLLDGGVTTDLPAEIAILAGRFERDYLSTFADEEIAEIERARSVAAALAPGMTPFSFRQASASDLRVGPRSRRVVPSATMREQLWAGTQGKLDAISREAYSPSAVPLPQKLGSMASAFAPLATLFGATFDRARPERSSTRLGVYFPALHTLQADDFENPETWFLDRGILPLKLPEPVQVSAAHITHLGYLGEPDPAASQGMRFEVKRDFVDPQTVTMTVGFGRLFVHRSDDPLGFDSSQSRDSARLLLVARMPVAEGDGERIRTAKEQFNTAMAGFEIEARVHDLTLRFVKDDRGKLAHQEQLLRPSFSLEESRISFRVSRYTESAAERTSLKASGFICEPANGRPGFVCWREFWSWDQMRAFVGDRGGLGTLLARGRELLLGRAVARALQLVLDQSIESIQRSVDQQLAHIVTMSLERFSTARDALANRLRLLDA